MTVGLAAAIGGWAGSTPAWAGGGPENLLLVVNTNSWASQTVANHYIHLRQIPADNVCYLDWNGGVGRTDVANFRREILAPALRHIAQRGLDGQIDYIVYSSDFPTGVEVDSYVRGVNLPSQLTPSASINSATYFWQAIINHSPLVVGLENNHYMRPDRAGGPVAAAHGFRAWYGWGSGGELLEAGGQQYLLSTMLAVTSGRGNSVAEAIRYLDRSAKADGTHPAGTIYYMKNSDVRSTVRRCRLWGGGGRVEKNGHRRGGRLGCHSDPPPRRARADDGHPGVRLAAFGKHDLARRCASTSPAMAA